MLGEFEKWHRERWLVRLLSLEVGVVGDEVGADVAFGGYDDEFAGGVEVVEVVAVFGL